MDYLADVLHGRDQDNPSYFNHLRAALKIERRHIGLALGKYPFWYVDIPRTGSTSIQHAIGLKFGHPFGKDQLTDGTPEQFGMRSALLPNHTPAFIAQKVISDSLWDQLRTFSVVRHPVSWAVSFWQYSKSYGGIRFDGESFEEFLTFLADNTNAPATERSFRPASYLQSDYLFCPVSGKKLVDDVLRFEERDGIIDWMAINLGIELDDNVKMMTTPAEYMEISSAQEALARQVLREDFERLGYE